MEALPRVPSSGAGLAVFNCYDQLRREIQALLSENEELKRVVKLIRENQQLRDAIRSRPNLPPGVAPVFIPSPRANLRSAGSSSWAPLPMEQDSSGLSSPPLSGGRPLSHPFSSSSYPVSWRRTFTGVPSTSGSHDDPLQRLSCPLDRFGPAGPSTDTPGSATQSLPLNATYDAPLNTTYDAPLNTTYDAPLNTTYDAPLNATYDVPLNATYDLSQESTYGSSQESTYDSSTYSDDVFLPGPGTPRTPPGDPSPHRGHFLFPRRPEKAKAPAPATPLPPIPLPPAQVPPDTPPADHSTPTPQPQPQRPPDVRPKEPPRRITRTTDRPVSVRESARTGGQRDARQQMWERIVGEIAFQLDRRILSTVFPDRVRLYGFTVSNIPDKIMKTVINAPAGSFDERYCAAVMRRYATVMSRLRELGYSPEVHPAFTESVVNSYGILRERPELAGPDARSYNSPGFLRRVVLETVPPEMQPDMLLLLECLHELAQDDGKPMFIW